MSEQTDTTTEVQEILDRDVRAAVYDISNRLVECADRLRQLAARNVKLYDRDGLPAHHALAARVASELRGLTGNIMVDRLIEVAAEAELYATKNGHCHVQ